MDDKQTWCAKNPHKTRGKAEKAMARGKKGFKRVGHKISRPKIARDVNVYRCDVCGNWHWGHVPIKRHLNHKPKKGKTSGVAKGD